MPWAGRTNLPTLHLCRWTQWCSHSRTSFSTSDPPKKSWSMRTSSSNSAPSRTDRTSSRKRLVYLLSNLVLGTFGFGWFVSFSCLYWTLTGDDHAGPGLCGSTQCLQHSSSFFRVRWRGSRRIMEGDSKPTVRVVRYVRARISSTCSLRCVINPLLYISTPFLVYRCDAFTMFSTFLLSWSLFDQR